MFKHLHLVLVIWALVISSVQAKSYIRDYTYKASDIDSKVTSRTNALDQVKLILLQEIGTHIHQEINITKDGSGNSYASEDVEAITAGFTRVDIIEERWNGETYYLKAKIDADTGNVLRVLTEIKNEKSEEKERQLKNIKNNNRKDKKYRAEIKNLKKQLELASSKAKKERIANQYAIKVNKILISDIYKKGFSYSQDRNWKEAIFWLKKAAVQGHLAAQIDLSDAYEKESDYQDWAKSSYWLEKAASQDTPDMPNLAALIGFNYYYGRGVERNHKTALNWYLKSAKGSDCQAGSAAKCSDYQAGSEFSVGLVYFTGNDGIKLDKDKSVKTNYIKAAYWFTKAAKHGHDGAQFRLGRMYANGLGVKEDKTKASFWVRKSAKQGNPDSQALLSLMYHKGEGVKQDKIKAEFWVRKAAENGDKTAQKTLGSLYLNGSIEHGIKKDIKSAKKWLKISCDNSYKKACLLLNEL